MKWRESDDYDRKTLRERKVFFRGKISNDAMYNFYLEWEAERGTCASKYFGDKTNSLEKCIHKFWGHITLLSLHGARHSV